MMNFTAAHEGEDGLPPAQRMSYPDDHVEVDNRLSWFLGVLADRYPEARYVHLRRDPEAIAASWLKRWPRDPAAISPLRHPLRKLKRVLNTTWGPGTRPGNGIVAAFAHPMLARRDPWPVEERLRVCRYYVDTVGLNIEHFLRDKPSMTIDLETAGDQLAAFWEWIGATGDLDAAIAEFDVRHNRS